VSGLRCFYLEPTERTTYEMFIECSTCNVTVTLPSPTGEWGDAPWPERCGACDAPHDYDADDGSWRSLRTHNWYRRADTGEALRLQDAPPGAIWNAEWMMRSGTTTADGRYLVCRLPDGHDWAIDSRASNCGRPEDADHDCWCRHGDPPDLTVDKNPEPGRSTCTAGAGSIATPGWHGFLRNGHLVPA
jgi:hypothetical protein